MSFVDFTEAKARSSIEQAAKLLPRDSRSAGYRLCAERLMKGYVAIPIRLPTGELTGYIGITEAKLPKEFHLSNVVTFPKKTA